MKVLLLIRKLELGGAEVQLSYLAQGLVTRGHQVTIVTFYPGGEIQEDLKKNGLEIVTLKKRSRWDWFRPVARFYRLVTRTHTDVVYSFLTGPNILAVLAKMRIRRVKVVWGVRASSPDAEIRPDDLLVSLLSKISMRLFFLVDRIIVNSDQAREYLITNKIPSHKIALIQNGVDTERFGCWPQAREEYRREHKIPREVFLIGMIARLDPIKNYEMYIESASRILLTDPDYLFLIVGAGETQYEKQLRSLVKRLGVSDKIVFCGAQKFVGKILNSLDVFVLTSKSEGFSNALAEALASGVPTIATTVGDNKTLLSDWGIGIDSEDIGALVREIRRIKKKKVSYERRTEAAQQFSDRFRIARMVDETLVCFKS